MAAKTQFKEKHDPAYWQALIETMETLVEEPNRETSEKTSHWEDQAWSAKPIYMGIDGTFINAQPGSDFSRPKSALCLLSRGLESVKGETSC